MNITTTTTTTTATNTTTNTIKTPEPETETPSRILHTKPVSITNGVLKRHQPLNQHHHHHHNVPILVIYKECLKNHAASLGGHALDGCGEFMPSPSATPTDPTSLKCAACGCHRNFHRREPEDPLTPPNNAVVEFQPHHRHHPPPPRGGDSSPNSPSPPPISSAYYPASAPHLLLALSGGLSGPKPEINPTSGNGSAPIAGHPRGRKRFRTKFTQNQKDRMFAFAERVGWKIQRSDEGAIAEFCSEIGVDRGVLKVWMHNNKSTLGTKREITIPNINGDNNIDGAHENNKKNNIASSGSQENLGQHSGSGSPHNVVCTIGNSSSSS